MALYALGDLHLAYQSEKTMDIFGKVWKNHEKKTEKNCAKLMTDEDTLVLVGDHSWGRHLDECEYDLRFIESLPGRKILVRGNHDNFWDAKKTQRLNDMFKDRLYFLQNNFYSYKDYAIVGTKGYCYEGFDTREHADMLIEREAKRLKVSFEEARKAGYEKFIMFLHYPPTELGERDSRFTYMAKAYGVSQVVYAHCHGKERFHDSLLGKVDGIEYSLVSGDFLDFKPKLILP
ncbi:MAG: metallophosphoesterase [Butyrivibrio sp.]|uniref:metallophosphoesterase n=1 Tax=Butyrivibrio sp. NC2002 TaxID=1410610 RepID=UPI00055ADED4|nr:metallophosphoesterase [Butyrivibrio sp. NC2002]MBE5859036.1 metallophosphoesterase [Butyrivibrio sp.]